MTGAVRILYCCGLLASMLNGVSAAASLTSSLTKLNSTLSGYAIATTADPSYAVATEFYNNLEDGPHPLVPYSEPAVYVKAADTADMVAGIEFAIQNKLKTSFVANGHHFADVGLLSAGVTIDINDLVDGAVYTGNRTGYFQPGWTGGDYANFTEPYGLFPVEAHASGVGIAGFTLGGGNGWATTLVGHAVDNIIAFDVVNIWDYNTTGKLEIVTVDNTSYPDLFWGILGAGQNLAAVTGFYTQLHPLPKDRMYNEVTTVFPLEAASVAYAAWLEWKATIPLAVEATIIFSPLGPGLSGAIFSVTNWDPNGTDPERADPASAAALEDWVNIANATGAALQTIPAPSSWDDILSSNDMSQDYPDVVSYIYSPFMELDALNMSVFEDLVAHYGTLNGTNSIILISDTVQAQGNNSGTAYGFRNQTLVWVWGLWTRTEGGAAVDGDEANIAWVDATRPLFEPLTTGQYVNMVMYTHENDTQNSYLPESWTKVKELKAKYDPDNLFRDLDYYRPHIGNTDAYSSQDYDPSRSS